jgi:[ribosomal protein S18]-alanine N-acetyltransferase
MIKIMTSLFAEVKPFSEADFAEIVTWHYPAPYHIYNVADNIKARGEMLGGSYFAVHDERSSLTGLLCFGEAAQVSAGREMGLYGKGKTLDVGLGLRPDLTGRGLGIELLALGIEFACERSSCLDARGKGYASLRLTVAAFNQRATKLYARAGFKHRATFVAPTANGPTEFRIMQLDDAL